MNLRELPPVVAYDASAVVIAVISYINSELRLKKLANVRDKCLHQRNEWIVSLLDLTVKAGHTVIGSSALLVWA